MTIFSSELKAMQDARDLLDAVLTTSGVFMTTTQTSRALAEIERFLDEYRRTLRRDWRDDGETKAAPRLR